jgi:O-antigen ligase
LLDGMLRQSMARPDPTKSLSIVLTGLLVITPLALANGLFLSHDVMPKVVLILVGAALVLFLLPQWEPVIPLVWRQPRGRIFLCLAGAQALSLVLSTTSSTQPALSLAGTTWRRFGAAEQFGILIAAVAVACVQAARPDWIRQLFRGVAIGGGLVAFYGVCQFFGVDPFLPPVLYTVDYLGGIVRPPATLGHAIYFSTYLVPVVIIAAWSVWNETESGWKRMHAVTAALSALAILLSGTRSSTIALTAAVLLLAAQRPFRSVPRFGYKIAAGAAVVLVIGGAITLSPIGANLGGPRLGVWGDSLKMIGQHPVAGSGPETFGMEFRRIESVELSRAYPDFYHETPHNALLDVASAQGLPGLAILLGLFGLGCWPDTNKNAAGMRAEAHSHKGDALRACLRAAMFGLFVGSIFVSLSLTSALYLWCLTALSAVSALPVPIPPATSVLRIPATLLGGAFLALALILAIPDTALIRVRDAVAAKDPGAAHAALAEVSSWSFGLPGYELWSSREMASLGRALGQNPEGARAWTRAVEQSAQAEAGSEDRFNALYQSSVLAVSFADLQKAEVKAREAIVVAPNWYKPHLLLAQILQAENRNDEAGREARISADLGWRQK